MSGVNGERNGIWARILSVVIPMTVAGLIAWGSLRSEVDQHTKALEGKANRETVTVQYDEIIRRLDAIDRRLETR
jgi:hypothetical protein